MSLLVILTQRLKRGGLLELQGGVFELAEAEGIADTLAGTNLVEGFVLTF